MAAGSGKRFGSNKLLYLFKEKPMALWTLELAAALREAGHIKNIFFITSSVNGCAVRALANNIPNIIKVDNEHPELGQRESIRLGARLSNAGYLIFFPCDQPMLDRETVLRLIAARRRGAICRPEFNGVPGSPVLFSNEFRGELCSLGEGEHGREIIKRHPNALIRVCASSAASLLDFDTPLFGNNAVYGDAEAFDRSGVSA